MHKRRFNELKLTFALRPQGPLLIKSGQESGADPTLLDMNFVRTDHGGGGKTVFLPGSSLKGTMRSYAEKIARTLAEGFDPQASHIPLACNPLTRSDRPGDDFNCGYAIEQRKLDDAQAKHAQSCPICRTFGNTVMAAHMQLTDAYPIHPFKKDSADLWHQTNRTSERDGVAIDRISGSVAHGPFTLEVVTQGAFYTSLTLHNFQLWQLGLLGIVLRDLGDGRVPMGFAKSRGLGRLSISYVRAEISYLGRFEPVENGFDFAANVYDVAGFLQPETAHAYGYFDDPDKAIAMPPEAEMSEAGEYGRITMKLKGKHVHDLWRASVPHWASYVRAWQAEVSHVP
jgi:CRISPR/Cas system CSM-associated protein Csm3 (group 7 of RAMP superfamily)